MEHAVDATPSLGEIVANGIEMLGHRHVQLEHGRCRGKLAGRALGERKASTRAGEHDLSALLLRELRDAERERCIGEHAGDDDALSLEKTHGASDRRCGGDVTAGSGVQSPVRRGACAAGCAARCARLRRCGSASSAAPGPQARRSAPVSRPSAMTSRSARARSIGRWRWSTASSPTGPTTTWPWMRPTTRGPQAPTSSCWRRRGTAQRRPPTRSRSS